jgi:hypothetical protein
MSARLRRIERIVAHRQKELDDEVGALAAVRAREASAVALADAAREAARGAEDARRKLAEHGCDVLTFIEAEEWLATTAQRAQRAWLVVLQIRREIDAAQAVVLEAKMKLKQAEQLSERVTRAERLVEDRRERRRDDEHAARITQRKAAVAGDE